MHSNHTDKESMPSTIKNFIPLIGIFIFVVVFAGILLHISGTAMDLYSVMRFFMASFFLVFGTFKIMNLSGFASAYAMYDLVAMRLNMYGYLYPFIELGLGVAYLFDWNPCATNVITLCLMLVSALGVFKTLLQRQQIMCACLGAVFKIPMTYVTLVEDLLMAGMAIFMLFMQV